MLLSSWGVSGGVPLFPGWGGPRLQVLQPLECKSTLRVKEVNWPIPSGGRWVFSSEAREIS